jgi:hypothetical protein
MRLMRIYADTSVFGGLFDDEFADDSGRFFMAIRNGQFHLVVSDTLATELKGAPPHVQRVLLDLPPQQLEHVASSDESLVLRDAYLQAGVVGHRWIEDATHVAIATVNRVDVLVSWNFKHLVRLDRVRGFNGVNLRLGYPTLEIRSPKEIAYEAEEDV